MLSAVTENCRERRELRVLRASGIDPEESRSWGRLKKGEWSKSVCLSELGCGGDR